MIARLRGEVVAQEPFSVVVDCGGVGYDVAMTRRALARLAAGDRVVLLVHTLVAQDAMRLYGFLQAAEREAFVALLAVAGVGPRLALAILSELTPHALARVVAAADPAPLREISGVGKRTAERVLVELRDRLPDFAPPPQDDATAPARGALLADLHSALTNVGFPPPIAQAAARQALDEAPGETTLPQLLRRALQITHAPGGRAAAP